jgi:hypothetical protein
LLKKKIDKTWHLNQIKEIVLKRYNLLRQAAEIYLKNNKSVFLLLFSEVKLKEFFKRIGKAFKDVKIKIPIIDNPESYFHKKNFTRV